MSIESPHLRAVRTPTPKRATGPLRAVPSTGAGGMVELLWNERRVESYDLTHRIAIPLAGHPLTREAARRLGQTLAAWWTAEPGVLSNGTEVTFIDVELQDEPLTPPELVVTLTTAQPASDAQVANLRTIRDLRRAMREVRRAGGAADQGLAVVA